MEISAVDPSTSALDTLIDYLGDLSDTLSQSDMDAVNTAFLYPTGIPSSGTSINLSTATNNTIVLSQSEFNRAYLDHR
jgi:hypothetical protein